MFAPVFEATVTGGSASGCPVNWIVAGPGQIIGATNNPLVTVNGNAVWRSLFEGDGGRFYDVIVPVVNQRDADVRVWIVSSTDGTVAAATQNRVNNDIAMVNKIWEQGIGTLQRRGEELLRAPETGACGERASC